MAGIPASSLHITVAENTPKTSKKDCSTPASHAKPGSPRALPKSASFTPETEYQKELNSLVQVTMKVSMTFAPQQGQENFGQPCTLPEVILTLGVPGNDLVIPLNPVPGRPLSVNLNLLPKKVDVKSRLCSPNLASPTNAHMRPSSTNAGTTSEAQTLTSCSRDQWSLETNPRSPKEDCLSLTEKNHTAQLQKEMARGGEKRKGNPKKGREKAVQGKGKSAGRKEW
ncbi:uncharacterized protein LOC113140554 [Mastacembelus armatus]|uniref:uncharacterized protein LOC113140554 n=1 Tax=Mastacembelus armatus TaxID=205130 RepID=UPI000E461268|nr:uncharacterized protein LOC113140554 [Mastacembelus armatus]